MPDIEGDRAVFELIVELPHEARASAIEEHCADSPERAARVLRLLQAHEEAGETMAVAAVAESLSIAEGQVIGGRYTVRNLLGEGGMGAVYLAAQTSPSRDVALKVMRPGIAGPRAMRRFELEAELLGRLTHPGIARIFEAGMHERSPFFAMEYVEGETLSEYLARVRPGIPSCVELFMKICDAVQHAHAKGIVHRDLKPSNILIARDEQSGEVSPKVLDFGVARATDADLAQATMQTEVGQIIGTLPYMSPEQVAADPDALDTRSDVYALGIVLYEMLSGRLPYDLRKLAIAEAARVIREDDPGRLSTVDARYRGDIETIVSKALEKDRERRYQSAHDLAGDLRRYLADEPISARPPSAWYQIAKFSRRNKPLVTGSVAAVAALVLGLIGTSYFLVESNRQRMIAVEQGQAAEAARAAEMARADEVEQIADFQSNMLARIDPYDLGTTIRDAVAERAGEASETALADVNWTDVALRSLHAELFRPAIEAAREDYADQPLVRAGLLLSIGWGLRNAGLLDEAEDPLAESLEIRQSELGADHEDTGAAHVALSRLMGDLGRFDESLMHSSEALRIKRLMLGPGDDSVIFRGRSHGMKLVLQQRFEEAADMLRGVLEDTERANGPEHISTLTSAATYALALLRSGRLEEEEALYNTYFTPDALRIESTDPETLDAVDQLCTMLEIIGRTDETVPLLKSVLEARRAVLEAGSPDVLTSVEQLAYTYLSVGRPGDAEPLAREALAIAEQLHGTDHPTTLTKATLLANTLTHQGRVNEAAEHFFRVIDTFERGGMLGDLDAMAASLAAANALLGAHDFARAERAALAYERGSRETAFDAERMRLIAAELLSVVYADWHAADPDATRAKAAAFWRERLEALGGE